MMKTPAAPRRVYLVDRLALFIESFSQVLDGEADFEVVGGAVDSDRAWTDIAQLEPEIVLSDIELPGRGALRLAADVRRRYPAVKVALLAGYVSHVCLDEALRIKAHGYLLKSDPVPEVIAAIRGIAEGDVRFSEEVSRELTLDTKTSSYRVDSMYELSSLSGRQLEVLRHLSRGFTTKQVARMLSLTERAVESHKYRIMRKLHIHDRVALTMFAIREGLVVPQ
jgi:DNA-binding NarL/FixJ family response regulator